ncbi:MAG: type II toxin-antitoxin system VapC family toxin [Roseimicrobium sp.]
MSATADSSLLVALYLPEATSPAADAACASVSAPVLLTAWHRVEIANAFQRAVLQGRITATEAAQLWQDFTADVNAGRFTIAPVDHDAVLARTHALTQRHTATLGTRTLDLIHVASALELGAVDFLSLDTRQRQAATAEGLNVLP